MICSYARSLSAPVRIVSTAALDFGTLIPNGTGIGRVLINARTGVRRTNARRTNANVTPLGNDGFQRGLFEVTGAPRMLVNLTTSNAVVTLTGPGALSRRRAD